MFDYKDQLILRVASGSGGSGMLSFHRTKKHPRGGPDGGDGGKGGGIVFQSSVTVSDLEHLKKIKIYKAPAGFSGGKQLKKGRDGKDLIIPVPVGALIKNSENQVLIDFNKEKTETLLEGGSGGKGNAFFKNSRNQAPRHFQKGEKGESLKLILELKPLISVALIGKVNTGKSSFFNLATKAKSKVGSYPYSTLAPHIGQLREMEESCFIMDIPGLDRGASQSLAQGLSFLRSIQRAKMLLHFLDSQEDFLKNLKGIEEELKKFDKKNSSYLFEKLSQKRKFYIITKIDQVKNSAELKVKIKKIKLKKKDKLFLVSNKTKKGLKACLTALKSELKMT